MIETLIEFFSDLTLTKASALIAVLISFLSVNYVRNNIKVTKYIETVTASRKEWLEILRRDFAEIITFAVAVLNHTKRIENAESFYESVEFEQAVEAGVVNTYEVNSEIEDANMKLSSVKKAAAKVEIFKKIELTKLRLNPDDDTKLINTLSVLGDAYITDNYNSISDKLIFELREDAQALLKQEWEVVKDEVNDDFFKKVKRRLKKLKKWFDNKKKA